MALSSQHLELLPKLVSISIDFSPDRNVIKLSGIAPSLLYALKILLPDCGFSRQFNLQFGSLILMACILCLQTFCTRFINN